MAPPNSTVNTYGYIDPNHPHAVRQHQGVNQFSYDNNGNMVGRYTNSMTYDVENRLTRNSHSSGITDSVYNGDGRTASHFGHKRADGPAAV